MLEQLLFLLRLCLFVCFLAVVNIVTKINLGRKGFLFQHSDCGSTMLGTQGTSSGWEAGSETEAETWRSAAYRLAQLLFLDSLGHLPGDVTAHGELAAPPASVSS